MAKENKKKNNGLILLIMFVMVISTGFMIINIMALSINSTYARTDRDFSAMVTNINTKKRILPASRGVIYDANGWTLAKEETAYNIIAVLSKDRPSNGKIAYVDNPEATAIALSPILDVEVDVLIGYLTAPVYQTELGSKGRRLSEEVKEQIEALNLNGIEFEKTQIREYPLGVFASNLIGYAQEHDGELVGMMGIEQTFNDTLTGEDGMMILQTDKSGYVLSNMEGSRKDAVNGNDVYLTIDYTIQSALETAMRMTQEQNGASKIWGSVMEIDTGKILAWGQAPSFDPNVLDIKDYYNYGVQNTYEPGSTFKAITYAAAMDLGVYDPWATSSSGKYCYISDANRDPRRVSEDNANKIGCVNNARYKDWGYITYDKGMVYSSNVLTATLLSERLGTKNFNDYIERFGFFEEMNIDGIKVSSGFQNYTWAADKVALSYGQGSTTTTMHLLQAFSALFGDGTMRQPYFVDKVVSSDDGSILYDASLVDNRKGNPIKESTAKQIQDLLYRVVNDEDGTARNYKIDEVSIIGKTGTTQVSSLGGSGYDTNRTITSVVLGMPADNPQYIITYAFEAEYDWLSHAKTDPVKHLLTTMATNLRLTENLNTATYQAMQTTELQEMESFIGKNVLDVIGGSNQYYMDLILLGDYDQNSKILKQSLDAGDPIVADQKVFVRTDSGDVKMPDIKGWTKKEITALNSILGLQLTYDGSGVCTSQSIEAGTILESGVTYNLVASMK